MGYGMWSRCVSEATEATEHARVHLAPETPQVSSSTGEEVQDGSETLLDSRHTAEVAGQDRHAPKPDFFTSVLYFASSPLELLTHPAETLKQQRRACGVDGRLRPNQLHLSGPRRKPWASCQLLVRDRRACSDVGSSDQRGLGVDISQGSWISLGKFFTWILWSRRPPCRDEQGRWTPKRKLH